MAVQNLVWVIYPATWQIIPGWEDTTWSIEVMALGLVSEGLLINPLQCLPLILHGLSWGFPNIQATQGRRFLVLISFLVIILLLDSMMRDLKDQWFSLRY